MNKFKPRNLTAVGLSLTWFLISLFFILQGNFLAIWIPFASVSLVIGIAAVWVLVNDQAE